jgi:hypothetical protein
MQFEPYNVDHDQFKAGLRDYRPRPNGNDPPVLRWLLLVTLIALAFIIGFTAGRNL